MFLMNDTVIISVCNSDKHSGDCTILLTYLVLKIYSEVDTTCVISVIILFIFGKAASGIPSKMLVSILSFVDIIKAISIQNCLYDKKVNVTGRGR